LLAGINEKTNYNDVPKAFQGYPVRLIAAGLMAIAFLGFTGLI
jgi:electron transport complex protein RnfA